MPVTMHLSLAEPPHIRLDNGTRIALMPRDAALLAWLAIEGPTPRARIAALLWPGVNARAASNGLRQRIFKLNKATGTELLLGAPWLLLADAVYREIAGAADLQGVAAMAGAAEFEDWLAAQKTRLERQDVQVLLEQVRALEERGDLRAAMPLAQALLERTPLSEPAHRRVMRLLYLLGDRAGALAAFDRCEQVLKHELSAQPAPETRALLASIEAAQAAPLAPASRRLPATVLRPPRMVGRTRELATLSAAWDAGHVAAVIGEAGVGKSRLLSEFAGTRPGLVYAAGRPGDAGVPFASLARLLRAVAEHHAQAPLAPEHSRQLARVLPELGAADAPLASDPARQRLMLNAAISDVLGRAQGLRGLLFDDLHFADAASLEMVQSLVAGSGFEPHTEGQAGGGPRWAVGYRPPEAGSPLQALQSALADLAVLAPVNLAPLPLGDLRDLVDQLQIGLDGEAIAPQLLQRTGGNPLFVLETLKQAWVTQAGQDLCGPLTLPKPSSVERLIDRRVSQLSPQGLALARLASIAGEDFDIGLAEAALGHSAVHLADALIELESAQILKGTQFAHDLVFDAVRRSVPLAIGRHLHAQVAHWLEQHASEPARVARHLLEAGEPARALPWLRGAAERAGQALRNRERVAFLDLQAGIERELGRPADAFRTLLCALDEYTTDLGSGEEARRRCDELAQLASNDEQHILAARMAAMVAGHRGELVQAEAHARRALALAEASGRLEWVRRSQLRLFDVLSLAARSDEALALGESCLQWVGELDDAVAEAILRGNLGNLYLNLGRLSASIGMQQRAAELALALGRDDEYVTAIHNLGNCHAQMGQTRQACAVRRQALELAERYESAARHMGPTLPLLAGGLISLCEFSEALQLCERAEPLLAGAFPAAVPLVWARRAACWLRLGQFARTTQELERIAQAPQAIEAARLSWRLLCYRLELAMGRSGEAQMSAYLAELGPKGALHMRIVADIEQAMGLPPSQALPALDELRDLARRHEFGGHVLETHVRAAKVATATDPARAREHALAALAMAHDYVPSTSYLGELWLHSSQALLAAGDTARGERVLSEGLAWLQCTLRDHVPVEFRESFRYRNATNAALFLLAAKQGLGA